MLRPSERGIEKTHVPFFRLRNFDIRVGDIVQGHDVIFNDVRKYRVTGIYPYIFTVETIDRTYGTSFQKKEYQVGGVQKVRSRNE